MAGGRGVDHHELVTRFVHSARELLEDRDLFGTRGQEIFSEGGPAVVVKFSALRGNNVVTIMPRCFLGVDARDGEAGHATVQCFGEMGRGVSGREVHPVPTFGQGDRDS